MTTFLILLNNKEKHMTVLTKLDRFDPFFVVFDRLFNQLSAFDSRPSQPNNYPPYNIIRNGENDYTIEVALAGFSDNQIEVVHEPENSSLVISGSNESEDANYLHQGIATRKFHRRWTIADTIQVKGANFTDGILRVQLENVIPDEKKPKKIKVESVMSIAE